MNAERRLTITIIGAVTLLALVALAALAALDQPIPGVLENVVIAGIAILTPSPLSKSSTAER
jgi:hypothetical protein